MLFREHGGRSLAPLSPAQLGDSHSMVTSMEDGDSDTVKIHVTASQQEDDEDDDTTAYIRVSEAGLSSHSLLVKTDISISNNLIC